MYWAMPLVMVGTLTELDDSGQKFKMTLLFVPALALVCHGGPHLVQFVLILPFLLLKKTTIRRNPSDLTLGPASDLLIIHS